jgi:hypothetical protein
VYTPTTAQTGLLWSDDFSAYTLGQFLDGDPTDGGWKGWDDDPTFGAFVVDTYELSIPHSVEIVADVDLVREYSGYTVGNYTFKTYVYIPDDFVGQSYFIMLSDYTDGAGQNNKWAVQLRMDSDLGVVEYEHDGIQDVLITGQWIEIRVEIDLDNDWHQFYWDGLLLAEKAWTAGPNNGGDGFLNIAAVDLFANGATAVYYDDMTLYGPDIQIPDLGVTGELAWAQVPAGSTQTATLEVSNVGTPGSELDWEVESWPSWGTWTFTPSSGTDLTPTGSPTSVNVEVKAPNQKEEEFDGVVKFVNSEDPSDFVEIPVTLTTPQPYNAPIFNLFQRILSYFPLLQRLFA